MRAILSEREDGKHKGSKDLELITYIQKINELYTIQQRVVPEVISKNAQVLLSEVKYRIQEQGKATSGGQIGQYSTKPAYYGQTMFVNPSAFKPQGKNSKSPVKSLGQPRKTMYLSHGYKELRQIQSLETRHVNETYSGKTMNDYRSETTDKAVLQGFITQRSSEIRKGQENIRFKQPIFTPSMSERNEYGKRVGEDISLLTSKILKS